MAMVSTVVSDSENSTGVPEGNDDKQPQTRNEGGNSGEEDEGDGSEYEIEAILDAKRGAFPDGRIGYLVKWKGFGDDENSWVDERDAENAADLVAEYWRKHPKKKTPRKSIDKPVKRVRKSTAPDDSSDMDSATLKKRGRKSTTRADSDDDGDESDARGAKRPKKANKEKKSATNTHPAMLSDDEVEIIEDMSKYMNVASWEELVDTVDTVERDDDNLIVYFSLKSGERVKESSTLCGERFPRKLLSFYEGNLRWRSASDSEV